MSDFYDLMRAINTGGSGGGGTSNYNQLSNKPPVNNVILQGNKSLSDLGLYSKSEVDALVSGGENVIETEIEFVEETYEEDGEEYTELVTKFTNEEAILDAIYGENRDELNSPTIAIKYRVLYDPFEFFPEKSPNEIWKNMADEFTEYYHCISSISLDEDNDYAEYHLYLEGKRGAFYSDLVDENEYHTEVKCTGVQTILPIHTVVDENLKPCGLNVIDIYGAVFFEKYSPNEYYRFVYPMIAIDRYISNEYIYSTEEYGYNSYPNYQMGSEDYFYNYLPSGFSTTNSKLSVASSCDYIITVGCKNSYVVQLFMNEEESFSDGELLVEFNTAAYTHDTITILGYSFINDTFADFVDLVLDPNGTIYTRQSISGVTSIRFTVTYQIDPSYMPILW